MGIIRIVVTEWLHSLVLLVDWSRCIKPGYNTYMVNNNSGRYIHAILWPDQLSLHAYFKDSSMMLRFMYCDQEFFDKVEQMIINLFELLRDD